MQSHTLTHTQRESEKREKEGTLLSLRKEFGWKHGCAAQRSTITAVGYKLQLIGETSSNKYLKMKLFERRSLPYGKARDGTESCWTLDGKKQPPPQHPTQQTQKKRCMQGSRITSSLYQFPPKLQQVTPPPAPRPMLKKLNGKLLGNLSTIQNWSYCNHPLLSIQ